MVSRNALSQLTLTLHFLCKAFSPLFISILKLGFLHLVLQHLNSLHIPQARSMIQ